MASGDIHMCGRMRRSIHPRERGVAILDVFSSSLHHRADVDFLIRLFRHFRIRGSVVDLSLRGLSSSRDQRDIVGGAVRPKTRVGPMDFGNARSPSMVTGALRDCQPDLHEQLFLVHRVLLPNEIHSALSNGEDGIVEHHLQLPHRRRSLRQQGLGCRGTQPSKVQLDALRAVIDNCIETGKLTHDCKLIARRQLLRDSTLNPGDALYDAIKALPYWSPL
ncbi:PREDICTED: uncharacterized protein LOC106740540 isoform X3 [Dinoponera quadriceps]|uniref:Uncharacterized protein LOC106740540 isoform X3 n=1 Tax=Dinoponera quadriceps TaxID=609295 RepID=A0A6P3WM96_DINQU|nr:PREDICTED: uncharacterized protein LOC106740540 isoform X3 [Dinoponera quadriceps]